MIAAGRYGGLLLSLVLAGCSTGRYYLPVDGTEAYTGRACGTPYGGARIELDQDARLFVSMHPDASGLWVSLQVLVLGQSRLEFLSSELQVQPVGGEPVTATLSPGVGGDPPSLDPRVPIVAGMLDRFFVANVQTPPGAPGRIMLRLPPFRVNGRILPPRELLFDYIEKTGIVSCVQ